MRFHRWSVFMRVFKILFLSWSFTFSLWYIWVWNWGVFFPIQEMLCSFALQTHWIFLNSAMFSTIMTSTIWSLTFFLFSPYGIIILDCFTLPSISLSVSLIFSIPFPLCAVSWVISKMYPPILFLALCILLCKLFMEVISKCIFSIFKIFYLLFLKFSFLFFHYIHSFFGRNEIMNELFGKNSSHSLGWILSFFYSLIYSYWVWIL